MTINNTGDVAAFPVWTVEGPITNLSISDGSQSFSFSGTVAAGQTVTIDTEGSLVTDSGGVNVYASLAAAPKFFSLQPGLTTLTVSGIEATIATRITCTYALRYEVVH